MTLSMTMLTPGLELDRFVGHVAGAFTDAKGDLPGAVEAAHGGSLLLDEIGDATAPVQGILLHVLEDREIQRQGEFVFLYDTEGRLDSLAYPNYTGEKLSYYPDGSLHTRRIRSARPGQNACPVSGSESCFPDNVIRADTLTYTNDGLLAVARNAGREWFDFLYLGLGQTGYGARGFWQVRHDPTQGSWATSVEWFRPDAFGNMLSRDRRVPNDVLEEDFLYGSSTGRLMTDTLSRWSQGTNVWPGNRWYQADGSLHLEQTFQNVGRCSNADVFWCVETYTAIAEVVSRLNYDAEGRLRTAHRRVAFNTPDRGQEGGVERSYYDPYGRRVMRTWLSDPYSIGIQSRVDEHHERYVWDGSQILYEVRARAVGASADDDDASNPEFGRVAYVHGPGIDRPLEVFRADGYFGANGHTDDRLFLYADFRGSITLGAWTDGSQDRDSVIGSVVRPAFVDWTSRNQSVYKAQNAGYNLSNLNFFGSLLSEQVGGAKLQYLRNRFYDPQTGRFTQEDPIGLAGGLNLYGFAGGDPVNFSDPFGLCPNPPCRSPDDSMRDRPLPDGVNPDDVTWDPDLGHKGGYRHDKDQRLFVPHPEDTKHWDHWDVVKPRSPGQEHEQQRWPERSFKPGYGPRDLRTPVDPWKGPLERFMDGLKDMWDGIERFLAPRPIPGNPGIPLLPPIPMPGPGGLPIMF